jgi:hypothetical protein
MRIVAFSEKAYDFLRTEFASHTIDVRSSVQVVDVFLVLRNPRLVFLYLFVQARLCLL